MAASDEQTFLAKDDIRKAVEDSGGTEGGRVLKVLYLDDAGEPVGEWASRQVPEDPFRGMDSQGIVDPPFPMEQLIFLAESHPIHSAALEQKVADTTGAGWEWVPLQEDTADETIRDEIADWLENLSPDDVDMHEVISSAYNDMETVGWGLIEIARDPSGIVKRVYHVPGHTVRAHRDGYRLCQIRGEKKVWFKRWGAKGPDGEDIEVDSKSGQMKNVNPDRVANELLVIKRPSRRSSWYGIPGYIAATGWITLGLAARDDNLMFFANRREPRWAIVLSNISADSGLEEDLRRAFVIDMRQPHRNMLIPITGPGKIEFQKLSDNAKDGSFANLSDASDRRIMVAHRVPGERIANATVGPLGGNATMEASKIYKDGVVTPAQSLMSKRINRFISVEYPKSVGATPGKDGQYEPVPWVLDLLDLDLDDARQDLDMAVLQFHGNMITLAEARAMIGRGPLMRKPPGPQVDPLTGEQIDQEAQEVDDNGEVESPYNEMLFTELPGATAQAGNTGRNPAGIGGVTASREDPQFRALGDGIRRMLWEQREQYDKIQETIADRGATDE